MPRNAGSTCASRWATESPRHCASYKKGPATAGPFWLPIQCRKSLTGAANRRKEGAGGARVPFGDGSQVIHLWGQRWISSSAKGARPRVAGERARVWVRGYRRYWCFVLFPGLSRRKAPSPFLPSMESSYRARERLWRLATICSVTGWAFMPAHSSSYRQMPAFQATARFRYRWVGASRPTSLLHPSASSETGTWISPICMPFLQKTGCGPCRPILATLLPPHTCAAAASERLLWCRGNRVAGFFHRSSIGRGIPCTCRELATKSFCTDQALLRLRLMELLTRLSP